MSLALLSASVLYPVAAPPVVDGGVLLDGPIIRAVAPAAEIRRQFPEAVEYAFPGHALLPGLVNAHTHLELSWLRGVLPPSPFVDWVIRLIREVRARGEAADMVAAAVDAGLNESLRAGVTTVGDISRQVTAARPALRRGPLRVVSFGEIQALGQRRHGLHERLAAARDAACASDMLRIGLSPHAPYTVEGTALEQVIAAARDDGLPVAMHLAELTEEGPFLAELSGGIRQVWESVGIAAYLLDDQIPRFAGGPIRWAQHHGLLPSRTAASQVPTVLAHVNYVDDAELDILSASAASVAYCPRTRAFFGHDAMTPHRFRDMLSRGINVCLATDSLASNPDLSLLREAGFVLQHHPDLPPAVILDMITLNGARALGLADQVGSLQPGKAADVIALKFPSTLADYDPVGLLGALLAQAPAPRAVWLAGERLV